MKPLLKKLNNVVWVPGANHGLVLAETACYNVQMITA
jgi:hypothetical protein